MLVLLLLVARSMAIWFQAESLQKDPDLYRTIARSLRTGAGYARPDDAGVFWPTAFRPPLYPVLLAATSLSPEIPARNIAFLHIMIGAASAYAVTRLGRAWGLGWRADLAAGLLAVDPLLLLQSVQVMTEPLAALLTIFALIQWAKWRTTPTRHSAALAGIIAGLAILCRPTFLPWVLAAPTITVIRRWRTIPWAHAVCFLAAAGITLAPWAVRNRLQFDTWIVTTTHGGYTLLLGNNDSFYDALLPPPTRAPSRVSQDEATRPWSAEPLQATIDDALARNEWNLVRDEKQLDAELARAAWHTIRERPAAFVAACVYRVGQFWSPWGHAVDEESTLRHNARRLSAVWYTALLIVFGWSLWTNRRRIASTALADGVVLVLVFTAVHAIYWSNPRMRAPVMPVVYLIATLPLRPRETP